MRVAIVYDRVNTWGGAERVLLALHDLWPEAALYTAVYDADRAKWANIWNVNPSFMQYVPFAKRHHEWFPWLTPMAFESFSFDGFDVVISVTSAEAKCVITKPQTMHVCYCLTPTRYLWNSYDTYARRSAILRLLAPRLRRWDTIASSRPDYYIAISNRVKERIETYYGRDVVSVLYPPVDVHPFRQFAQKDYFLVVSRLVPYKRIDLIIEAFNELALPLVIIGSGREERLLRSIASGTITFVSSRLTDADLAAYYGGCRGLLSAADEDFGIAAVEALAAGRPVVAFAESGTAEAVEEGKTGVLFHEQSKAAIIEAVRRLQRMAIQPRSCWAQAQRFSKQRFVRAMRTTVTTLYTTYTREYYPKKP